MSGDDQLGSARRFAEYAGNHAQQLGMQTHFRFVHKSGAGTYELFQTISNLLLPVPWQCPPQFAQLSRTMAWSVRAAALDTFVVRSSTGAVLVARVFFQLVFPVVLCYIQNMYAYASGISMSGYIWAIVLGKWNETDRE